MFSYLSAKHLATNSCKSAYKSLEEAKKAVKELPSASFAPLVDIPEDDSEIVSFDPNVVMAKAYHQGNKEDKSKTGPRENDGPLAFLGLQRKTSVDEKDETAPDPPGGGGGGEGVSSTMLSGEIVDGGKDKETSKVSGEESVDDNDKDAGKEKEPEESTRSPAAQEVAESVAQGSSEVATTSDTGALEDKGD